MTPRAVRLVVVAVSVVGIAGMIVGSIADNNGTAITFGLIAATASLGLILVTSVVGTRGFDRRPEAPITDEEAALDLERQVADLVAQGADEVRVRDLVRDAIRLGRRAEHGHQRA